MHGAVPRSLKLVKGSRRKQRRSRKLTERGVLSAGMGTCRQTHKDRRTCGQPAGRAAGAGVQGGQTPPYSGLGWVGGSGRPTRRSPGAPSAPPWGMGGFSPGLWSRGGDGRVEGSGAVTTGGRGEARDPLSLSKEAHGLSLDPKGACGSVELSAASPPQLKALGNDAGGGNRGSPPKIAQPLRPRLGPTEHRAGAGASFCPQSLSQEATTGA